MDEARAHHEAALAYHRAVSNRRDEGIVLGNLGELVFRERLMGSWQDAYDCYRAALAIAKEVGYRRAEGGVLGSLAELLATQGRIEEARVALRAGDALLRGLGDRLGLGKLLCVRVRVELGDSKVDAARSALVEAEALAALTNAGPESELGGEIAKLRNTLT